MWSMYKNIASVGSGKIVDSSTNEPTGFCSKKYWEFAKFNPSKQNLNNFINNCKDKDSKYRLEQSPNTNFYMKITKPT